MRPDLKAADTGVSLIEILIAVLVLSIGVIASFQSLGQARIAIGGELPRLLARTAALNRAEELQLIGANAGQALPRVVRVGPYDWTLTVDQAPTEGGFVQATIHATAQGLPGAVFVTYIPIRPVQ